MARSPITTLLFDGQTGRTQRGFVVPPGGMLRFRDINIPIVGAAPGSRVDSVVIDPGDSGDFRLIAGEVTDPTGTGPTLPYVLVYLALDSPIDGFGDAWSVGAWQGLGYMDDDSDGVHVTVCDGWALVAIPNDFHGGRTPTHEFCEVGFVWNEQQFWLSYGTEVRLESHPQGEEDPRRAPLTLKKVKDQK